MFRFDHLNFKTKKMKKIFTTILFTTLALANVNSFAQTAKKCKIKIQCSDPDAIITVNGNSAGNGMAKIVVLPNQSIKITAIKEGLFTKEVEYSNNGMTQIPKELQLKLEKDVAFEASVKTDIANVDINLVTKKGQLESWKAINSLITSYFDAVEVSDKDNFYLRTAWVATNQNSGMYRTRVIVKANGNENFFLKIVSEKSPVGTGIKEDEKFKEWDRVFRKYAKLVEEIQNRL